MSPVPNHSATDAKGTGGNWTHVQLKRYSKLFTSLAQSWANKNKFLTSGYKVQQK